MPDDEFWAFLDLLQGSRTEQNTTNFDRLMASLTEAGPPKIGEFYETLVLKTHALDTEPHYRSFSMIPGISDDFLYFRLAIVASGKDRYEQVLMNPREFPSYWTPNCWNEQLMYVADYAYRAATGEDFNRESSVSIESFSNRKGWNK